MLYSDLHDYQHRAIEIGLRYKKCGLFLGLGLGKTIVALTIAAIELHTGRTKRVLVIAPLRVANTVWDTEAAQWTHTKGLSFAIATGDVESRTTELARDVNVHVINVDKVQWLIDNYPRSKWRWDFVIVDESSGFKSGSAKRTKELRKATVDKIKTIKGVGTLRRSPVRHLLLLSATPVTNGLQGLWAQVSLIDNGKRLGRSFNAYLKTYFYKPAGSSRHAKELPLPGSKQRIYDKLRDVTFVMRSDDYLTLPPLTYNTIEVSMSKTQMDMYKRLEREFLITLDTDDEFLTGEGEELIATNEAALSNKLLQFSNGAVYTGETPERRVARREYAVIHDAKLDALEELISAAEGCENLLVAYYYKSDLERILQRFPNAVVMDKKGDAVKPFNEGKIPMLLAHPDSAGMGLNLQRGSSTIVFFSLLWNLESYQQFVGRLYRQGQAKGVTVNHIVCKGTIERRVVAALSSKAETQEGFLRALSVTDEH